VTLGRATEARGEKKSNHETHERSQKTEDREQKKRSHGRIEGGVAASKGGDKRKLLWVLW
jgi:hypothetical protein